MTTDSAVGTGSEHFMVTRSCPARVAVHQCCGGADIYTCPAELTPGFFKWTVEGSADSCLASTVGKSHRRPASYLITDADAPAAENTKIILPLEEGVISVCLETFVDIRKVHLFHVEVAGYCLQFAALVFGAKVTSLGYRDIA